MKKIAVFTSGGDAPGMNACIRAVVRTGLHFGLEVFGIKRGYEGLIDDEMVPMKSHSVSNIIQLGGTILQTARSKRFLTPEGRRDAYENLTKRGIEGIVAIGGDGTFQGADVFTKEFPDIVIVGCPGTIDNDLVGTDFTIGYDTATNTAMQAIDNIKDTADSHNRLFFIEVMGRDAGFIALRTAIATGAEAVLVPETRTNLDRLVERLDYHYRRNRKTSGIVIVAEGDDAGGAVKVAEAVKQRFDYYEIKVGILGHIQRGGKPTCMERVRASQMGMEAVKALMAGEKGVMIGVVNNKVVYTPFEQAIKHHEDTNPVLLEMIDILS
ncbi:MAG: 6-phosphofructokinase [Lewinellaceae bacterium]|nr:6-phosphofructokinase [Saprospiraceae bacterium]MCB9338366.1 6-phosphofructokinase [Lewinellaceae bacterium]